MTTSDSSSARTVSAGSGGDARALEAAEAALSRIQSYAQAAEDARLTPSEAIEQILDELTARSALRQAASRSFSPSRPH